MISIFIIFLIIFFDGIRSRIIKTSLNDIFKEDKIMIFSYGHKVIF